MATTMRWVRSALVNDAVAAQNGGRPSASEIVSGLKNALFPDVTAGQRAAGLVTRRKAFVMVQSDDDAPLIDARVSIESGTPGESHVLLYPGTWTDTEATRTGRPYGYGRLAADVTAGAQSLTIETEADYSALTEKPFQVGDRLRVDARATVLEAGLSEYAQIASVSYASAMLTIGLAEGLVNAYTADEAHVASVIEPGDLATSVTGKSVTGGVTFDDTEHPIVVPQVGGVYQVWTVTVTNAATGALSVAGDTLGAVGTGSTGVDLAPSNPEGGTYFTLLSAGWGGTPATGDTLVFTTVPAGVPLWYDRVVPAGADAISSDGCAVCVEGSV